MRENILIIQIVLTFIIVVGNLLVIGHHFGKV